MTGKFAKISSFFVAIAVLTAAIAGNSIGARAGGCRLAVDPSLGKWIFRIDPDDYAAVRFPPGSVIKPFTVLAAVESGAGFSKIIRCLPSDPTTPVRESCWYRPGHGTVDIEKALAVSCDRYFLELARSVKWPVFLNVLLRFGVINSGDIPDLENIPFERRPEVMVGLGHEVKVSPLNLLLAYSALFNGGYLFEPADNGDFLLKRRISVDNRALKVLVEGLTGATVYGTASEIGKAFPGMRVISKTGTAIFSANGVTDRNRTHAWYVGLSPESTPRAAVVVFILHGSGSHDAVPAALRFWPEVVRRAAL